MKMQFIRMSLQKLRSFSQVIKNKYFYPNLTKLLMEAHQSSPPSSIPYQKQVLFMLDSRDSKIPTYLLIGITSQGVLQIVATRFKKLSAEQRSFEDELNLVESIGVQTYFSDRNLPSKLFQMRSIEKLFDYFSNVTKRVIRASTKTKNGVNMVVLEPMVPVTKNIKDFVPLQLDIIDSTYMNEFMASKRVILQLIFKKMHEDEREKMKELKRLEQIELQRTRREKDFSHQEQMSQGEIDWPGKESKQHCQQTSQYSQIDIEASCLYSNLILEEVGRDPQKYQFLQDENQFEANQSSQQISQEQDQTQLQQTDSVDDEPLLRSQYTALLEEKNQQLLKRLVDLQTLLLKKSFKLQLYEQPQYKQQDQSEKIRQHPKVSSHLINKVQQYSDILQSKYQAQIHLSIQSLENIRNHFYILKQLLCQTSALNQQNQFKPSKTKGTLYNNNLSQVMNQIQQIFQSI